MFGLSQLFMGWSRKDYVDGTACPLLRGVAHLIMSFCMTIFICFNSWYISWVGFASLILIWTCYVCSAVYHCVRLPDQKEVIANIIDHIAINFHAFGCILNIMTNTPFYWVIAIVYSLNCLIDSYLSLRYAYDYIFSMKHFVSFMLSLALVVISSIHHMIYISMLFTTIKFIVSYTFYGTGLLVYFKEIALNRMNRMSRIGQVDRLDLINKESKPKTKIWGSHETFHMLVVGGSVVMINIIISTHRLI
jgi:predicted membrane channel-forming protein YqfA (hemolysin III family)